MANYRVIVAGSRTFDDYDTMKMIINEVLHYVLWNEDDTVTFVSGHARGADMLGEKYAEEYGFHCDVFPAKWEQHGKSAGFIRNGEMADFATEDGYKGVLIAFYGGNVSGGTKNMIDQAHRHDMYTYVVSYKDGEVRDKAWLLSRKQDDEYLTYRVSERYKISMLDADSPTGLCMTALVQGSSCCDNCENIYCYDKSEGCKQRCQLKEADTGYNMYCDPMPTGADCKKTMQIVGDLQHGRIVRDDIRSAIEEFLETSNYPKSYLGGELENILMGISIGK